MVSSPQAITFKAAHISLSLILYFTIQIFFLSETIIANVIAARKSPKKTSKRKLNIAEKTIPTRLNSKFTDDHIVS